jgi:tetratricopeptide (TPR) repeat protein
MNRLYAELADQSKKSVGLQRHIVWLLLCAIMCSGSAGFSLVRTDQADRSDAFTEGLLALEQKQFEAALQHLTAAEQQNPSDPRVHNFRGIALAGLGRTAEAASEYRESIRLNPRRSEAYRNLGYLAWTAHRLEEAEDVLRTALTLDPGDHFTMYYLGRVELDRKQYQPAAEHLECASDLWPAEPDFLLALAGAEIKLHRSAAAENVLAKLDNLPLTVRQRVRLGTLLIAAQDNDAAVSLFRKLAALQTSPWAQFDLALAQLYAGHPAVAARLAQSLLKRDSSVSTWTLLGIAEARARDHDSAVAAFRKSAGLRPGEEERWLDLTRELMALKQFDSALDAVQQGLTNVPGSYSLRLRLGAIYLRSGKYHESEQVFRDLIARGEPLATTYIGLAQVLLRTGRADQAADELRGARQQSGDSFLLSYFLGIALDRAGNPADAVSAFRDAVRLGPASAEARLALGKSELRLGKAEPAIGDLNEALRLDPQNAQAKRLLAQAYAIERKPEQAARYTDVSAPGGSAGVETVSSDSPEPDDFTLPAWRYPDDD